MARLQQQTRLPMAGFFLPTHSGMSVIAVNSVKVVHAGSWSGAAKVAQSPRRGPG